VFFVYGGISVEGDAALALSNEIDELRAKHEVPPEFFLKFNPGPTDLPHPDFIELKQGVIELARKHDCKLFASLILHDVAISPSVARLNEINRIVYHFDCYLARPNSHGLVLIDRFNDKKIDHHLRQKFSVGITGLPYTPTKRLERVIGFHYAAIGQSHLCSVVDIALGSLRFAVNVCTANREASIPTAEKLMRLLSPLFFREEGSEKVSEIGLFFSPKVVNAPNYRSEYEKVQEFMSNCGVVPSQWSTGVSPY
jgi:hypothetical protein